jgi:hypothetical protein
MAKNLVGTNLECLRRVLESDGDFIEIKRIIDFLLHLPKLIQLNL